MGGSEVYEKIVQLKMKVLVKPLHNVTGWK